MRRNNRVPKNNFTSPKFAAKLGPTAALSLTQLGRELHKYFSGSPEETHNELESRFMVGALWSPKGPEGFWLGPSGPSCFKTPASSAWSGLLLRLRSGRNINPTADKKLPSKSFVPININFHLWPDGCSMKDSVGAKASQTFLRFAWGNTQRAGESLHGWDSLVT